jgi:prevent-host-death family protein
MAAARIKDTVPAGVARNRLGKLLQEAAQRKARFLITKSGEPMAVLLSVSDFDDMLEELDPEFQKSLQLATREYRSGKGVRLQDYLKRRLPARRAG